MYQYGNCGKVRYVDKNISHPLLCCIRQDVTLVSRRTVYADGFFLFAACAICQGI